MKPERFSAANAAAPKRRDMSFIWISLIVFLLFQSG
jgi:hypothetical protein